MINWRESMIAERDRQKCDAVILNGVIQSYEDEHVSILFGNVWVDVAGRVSDGCSAQLCPVDSGPDEYGVVVIHGIRFLVIPPVDFFQRQ